MFGAGNLEMSIYCPWVMENEKERQPYAIDELILKVNKVMRDKTSFDGFRFFSSKIRQIVKTSPFRIVTKCYLETNRDLVNVVVTQTRYPGGAVFC